MQAFRAALSIVSTRHQQSLDARPAIQLVNVNIGMEDVGGKATFREMTNFYGQLLLAVLGRSLRLSFVLFRIVEYQGLLVSSPSTIKS